MKRGEPHPENLISLADRSESDRKRIASLGGQKAGEMAKRRKALREELEFLLSQENIQQEICLALIREAINGNRSGSVTRAFETIRDTLGERAPDRLAVSDDNQLEFVLKIVDSDGNEDKTSISRYAE